MGCGREKKKDKKDAQQKDSGKCEISKNSSLQQMSVYFDV